MPGIREKYAYVLDIIGIGGSASREDLKRWVFGIYEDHRFALFKAISPRGISIYNGERISLIEKKLLSIRTISWGELSKKAKNKLMSPNILELVIERNK